MSNVIRFPVERAASRFQAEAAIRQALREELADPAAADDILRNMDGFLTVVFDATLRVDISVPDTAVAALIPQLSALQAALNGYTERLCVERTKAEVYRYLAGR